MTDFQCFYITFKFKCNLFIFQVDVNFDDVLDTWFGKSEASIDNIDIDAFLINAMFPVDFNVEETPIHFIQTKEEELEDIFKKICNQIYSHYHAKWYQYQMISSHASVVGGYSFLEKI